MHVLAESPEARSHTKALPGGKIDAKVGPRGRLIAVADGPSAMGFWVCDWCGHGSARVLHPQRPPKHNHLLRNQPCTGPQRLLDLAHAYETDLLTLDVDVPGFQGTQAAWRSVLYAIVEAACDVLEIARDDIGGSLSPAGADRWSVALFDTVSGGAGHVLQIEANLAKVLAAALERVSTCECGPETSCYGCLRSYGNQREHDELSRGAAGQILRRLLANNGEIERAYSHANNGAEAAPGTVPSGWAELWAAATPVERNVLAMLADRGAARPEQGTESAGGIPIPLAWPDRLLAADLGLEAEDILELKSEGWTVLSPGLALVKAARVPEPLGHLR